MPAVLSRALAFLALVPLASCELYFRSDENTGDDVPPPDSGVLPDAFVPPDAQEPDAPPADPPNPGFVNPTQSTRANVFRNGAWVDAGPADWSCLAQPPNETVPATGYTLTGTVRDAATSGGVGGATIAASVGGLPLASGTSSSGSGGMARGQYRLDIPTLPPNTSRIRFAVATMTSRNTISIDRYLGAFGTTTLDLPVMSEQTATQLPTLVGATVDPTSGLVVGEVRDCQGRPVSGAEVALSTVGTFVFHWPKSVTYYFSAAGAQSLPVRHEVRKETNSDGRFMIVGELPSGGEGYVQAWGYQTEADHVANALKLLGKSMGVVETRTVSVVLLGRSRGFIGL